MTRRVVQLAAFILLMALILFFSASTIAWAGAWVFLILYLMMIATNALILVPRGTDLAEERGKIAENVPQWDRILSPTMMIFGLLGSLLVAGLDFRYNWTSPLPGWLAWLGGMGVVVGFGLGSWAMITNRFFSTYVRIQTDRGHTVVTDGPYQIVRHPGYLGSLIMLPSIPLLLDSLWAFIPAVLGIVLLCIRTSLEDQLLQRELPGYVDYSRRVRFKLIPFIW